MTSYDAYRLEQIKYFNWIDTQIPKETRRSKELAAKIFVIRKEEPKKVVVIPSEEEKPVSKEKETKYSRFWLDWEHKYKSGMNVGAIARQYKCSRWAVQRRLELVGLYKRKAS